MRALAMSGRIGGPRLSADNPLILGSGSPRRREILSSLGVPLIVLPADIDENEFDGESPETYIERIVTAKRSAVREKASQSGRDGAPFLVADTLVTIDGKILGKPIDRRDAIRLLSWLNGRTHEVLTRYSIELTGEVREKTVRSRVEFRRLTEAELEGYADSGEGSDKAGSYALQGRGAALVRKVEGSVSGVIGLPAAEVSEDLSALGLWETFA
jgi:septum formation protein